MKILVVNRQNNLGDCMCQMRGIKEYRDKHPKDVLDFISNQYLHILAASHTDNFRAIHHASQVAIQGYLKETKEYDKVIEFQINWPLALEKGILYSWVKTTLGFEPSTDKPYWNIRPEEDMIAFFHNQKLRKRFSKIVLMQLETPSGYERSFRYEDWDKILDMIPPTVGIVYPGPLDLAYDHKLKPRENLIMLPGYDIGVNVALCSYVDFMVVAHGGMAMMAHIADKKQVVHTTFREASSENILNVPEWNNFTFPSNREVNWIEIEKAIKKYL